MRTNPSCHDWRKKAETQKMLRGSSLHFSIVAEKGREKKYSCTEVLYNVQKSCVALASDVALIIENIFPGRVALC